MEIRNRIKELRWVRAGDVAPHPRNWRRHPPEQRAALEKVLASVGWAGAMLAREGEDGSLTMIDGHLRGSLDPEARVPLLVTDLTESEAETMLLATDPLAMMAEADAGLLEALMADADPEVLSGIEPTLSKLLLEADGFHPAKWKDDDFIPDEIPQRVTLGETWQLGDHTLVCGDMFAQSAQVDLVVTSPPYNVSIKYGKHWDDMPQAEYLDLIRRAAIAVHGFLKPGRFVAWNVGVSPKTRHFDHAVLLESAGLVFRRQIAWNKMFAGVPLFGVTRNDPRARNYHPRYHHEVIYLFSKGEPEKSGKADIDDRFAGDVWNIHSAHSSADVPTIEAGHRNRATAGGEHPIKAHPAVYPVEVPEGVIRHLTSKWEMVLDPFCGAGTTLLACERLGRIGLGFELDSKYCDVAILRWEKMTGKRAVILNPSSEKIA